MGMYTEIFVNVDFKSDLPEDVVKTIKAMCDRNESIEYLEGKPARWSYLFNNGSFYTPLTSCANFTFNKIGNHYSLLAKGDIKNYENEIEEFFYFIRPHVETCGKTFIGYSRYEESVEPTLHYAGSD